MYNVITSIDVYIQLGLGFVGCMYSHRCVHTVRV